MKSAFLERLHHPDRPVIVFDGAMGTSLQTQNLTADDFGGAEYEGCNEYLVFTKPDAVAQVHREFLAAGADVIETDTFGAMSIVLAEYDLADQAYALNKAAAELAKQVAAEFSTPEKPRFVAGSIGPTTKLPTLGHIDYDTMKATVAEQADGLYDGGVDLFIVETCQDVLQIKAALNGIEEVFAKKGDRRPLMVSVTMELQGTMLVGSDITAMLSILEPFPIDILGLNCATGPRSHGRPHPLPVCQLALCHLLHPQRRHPRKRWWSCSLQADPNGTSHGAHALRRRSRRAGYWWLLRHPSRSHPAVGRAGNDVNAEGTSC
jgi:5-methyltetrahydrofolate--homocysteine methyltransferase